jgi:hypothetical protein
MIPETSVLSAELHEKPVNRQIEKSQMSGRY